MEEDCICDFIHIKRNGTDGTVYPLTRESEIVLGKSECCDFRVQVPSACDRHAKLRVDRRGKVYVSSLVETVPVSMDGQDVVKETEISNESVISVGSCKFRFVYHVGNPTSPLQEENRATPTSARKPRKSPRSASKDKENIKSPRSLPRSTPLSSRPATPQSTKKAETPSHISTPTSTPLSKKKRRVSTPTVPVRSRHSSVRSSSSLSSSLYTISEETPTQRPSTNTRSTPLSSRPATPQSTKKAETPSHISTPTSTPLSKKKRRVSTPTVPVRSRHSSVRSSSSSLSSSLYTISEETPTQRPSTKTTPCNTMSSVTPPTSEKSARMDTPRQRRSSRSRASYCSMSTSLMSIQEEDESLAISPSPMVTRNTQSHYNDYSSTAIVSAANPAKRVSRKSVSFGPVLSPEVFNKRLPPSTPVRAGKAPGGLRRSLPANFAMPQAVSEEEDEQDGEGEGEMVDYTMTGFEESCSESSSSDDEDTEMEEEEESEIEEEMVDTPVASPMQQATPVVRAVHSSFSSQPRYKKLPTPLRRAIQEKPRLRVSRRSARTSLGRGTPRRLHRSLTTPIRTAIHSRTALRKTRRALHTPLRRAIEDMPALRKTKRSMPTPLRREIEGSVELRKTKSYKTLVTPVRREIEGRPTLRKTKKSMPTPVRLQIEERPGLRKTKKSMPTPVRRGIESRPTLRKTKPTLPTPIREDIKNRPQLRKTKKSIPTPLKRAIKAGHVLRKTKRTLPTPLRTAIQQCPPLRATKKSLPRDLLDEIASRPTLHPTKKSMPTPLREEIQRGVTLRAVSTAAPSRPKRKHADTVLACETPVPMPSAKRRKVANTPLPYNADPGSITATDTPQAPTTKRSKRDYATTVTPSETPVPAPPTKRARVAASPAQNTPLPYNFIPFAGESSPAVDLTGLPRLFKSPCICNSADPADAFEVRLFGGSREVSFASPLACSAKKPTSRPNSAQALHSCLRSSGPPLFTIGTAKPLQQNGGQDKRTRKRTRAATTTCIRVTRSSAPKQNTPCNDPPVRTRGRSANNNDKENISLPVVRSTRSRAATTNQSELKSVQMQLAVTPLPARRSTRMSMRKEAPPSTESEGPKSRATAEGVSTRTCTKKSRSNEEKQIISTQPPQQTADTAKPSTRSRGQAKKSAPAATAETTGRSLRHSRRLVPAPQEQQQQAEKKVKESKTSEAPVTQTTGGRRTRQTVKKAPAAVEEEATTSRRPTPSVSYQETTSVPVRRSARLKK